MRRSTRNHDLPTWAIPEDHELVSPLLRTVLDAAEAELLRGDAELLDRPVLDVVVAGMTLENVLPRLLEGAVIVVPGDRSDVLVGAVVVAVVVLLARACSSSRSRISASTALAFVAATSADAVRCDMK